MNTSSISISLALILCAAPAPTVEESAIYRLKSVKGGVIAYKNEKPVTAFQSAWIGQSVRPGVVPIVSVSNPGVVSLLYSTGSEKAFQISLPKAIEIRQVLVGNNYVFTFATDRKLRRTSLLSGKTEMLIDASHLLHQNEMDEAEELGIAISPGGKFLAVGNYSKALFDEGSSQEPQWMTRIICVETGRELKSVLGAPKGWTGTGHLITEGYSYLKRPYSSKIWATRVSGQKTVLTRVFEGGYSRLIGNRMHYRTWTGDGRGRFKDIAVSTRTWQPVPAPSLDVTKDGEYYLEP